MLKHAMELLYLQYNQCYDIVKNDAHYSYYANEKIRHSLQVAGAGNYLVRHIEWLRDKPAEYLEMVRTAVLLHDVCRFSEISKSYHGDKGYDHGVAAYELLEHMPQFDDIRIRLPIKHHGHLIEDLYADEEYQNLPEDLQNEVRLICFVVRDADKIANFKMISYEPYYLPLFMGIYRELTAEDLRVSDHVKKSAFVCTTVQKPFCSVGDWATALLSWYLDINYRASIDFCRKFGIIDIMFQMYEQYCGDADFRQKYVAYVKEHLNAHKFID